MSDAAFNLMMVNRYPNWYEHLDDVNKAMEEEELLHACRTAAGWEMTEEGYWLAPDGTPEEDWEGPLPEGSDD